MWNVLRVLYALLVLNSAAGRIGIQPQCVPTFLSFCAEPVIVQTSDISNANSRGGVFRWIYNQTTFPTFANDKSREGVMTSLSDLHPLLSTSCSTHVNLFMCSVFSPACTPRGVVPPCRELCQKVRDDCKEVVKMFGIEWPELLSCDRFPTQQTSNGIYYDNQNGVMFVEKSLSPIWSEALLDDGNVCIPISNEDVVTPALKRLQTAQPNSTNQLTPNYSDFELKCPQQMRSPYDYSGFDFMGLENCTAPCPNMYLTESELLVVRCFVCAMAVICLIVTSFTILTFAIEPQRFGYPIRPIIYYSFSYVVVAIVYLVGFGLRETVACNQQIIDQNNEVVQGFAVVEGTHSRWCTLMFMVLYYFTVSGTIWWLVLTVTWFLEAGLKWTNETVDQYCVYYHVFSWGLSALQTLIVVISGKVEGDNIAGVCFVGLYDTNALRYFLLIPLCVYLTAGIIILLTGFFCLNGIRKSQEMAKNKKNLAKFMMRIAIFSVTFILPQIFLIIIWVVEDTNHEVWETAWYAKSCEKYGVPCPRASPLVDGPRPSAAMFILKYTMILSATLPSLFWVTSKKTLHSWKRFFREGRCRQDTTQGNLTQARLLDDSNGPHARDARSRKQPSDQNAAFGQIENQLGSSASVAAAAVRATSRANNWHDYSSSETDSLSSYSGTTLSRVIPRELAKNNGKRVVGRRTQNSNIVKCKTNSSIAKQRTQTQNKVTSNAQVHSTSSNLEEQISHRLNRNERKDGNSLKKQNDRSNSNTTSVSKLPPPSPIAHC